MNVLITGAAGGLGRAFAAECARRGYHIFLTDISEPALLSLKQGLERQFNVTITAKACDLTDERSVDEMLAVIDRNGIRFEMLLNIAGIDFEGSFLERPRETIVKIVSLNNEATLRITHAILSRRKEGKHFSLVFVSSLASMFPMPLKATYAASKRFLLDFSTSIRQELKGQNANALALCPGGLPTTNEAIQGIAAQGFWGDMTTGKPESVAHQTIERVLNGKRLYVPGVLNRALAFFGKIIPQSLIAAAVYRRWKNAQSKWLDEEKPGDSGHTFGSAGNA